jgi:hypothetical protein
MMSGLMMQFVRTKKIYVDLYVSLDRRHITEGLSRGIAKALIFAPGKFTMATWVTSYFVTALPASSFSWC